jgi:hypothetical protein
LRLRSRMGVGWGSLPHSWQLWLGRFFNIRGVSLRSCGLWRKLVLFGPSRCRFRAGLLLLGASSPREICAGGGPSKFQVPSSQFPKCPPRAVLRPRPGRVAWLPGHDLTLDIPRSGSEPLRWTRSPALASGLLSPVLSLRLVPR